MVYLFTEGQVTGSTASAKAPPPYYLYFTKYVITLTIVLGLRSVTCTTTGHKISASVTMTPFGVSATLL
jgi:hypothetical protein